MKQVLASLALLALAACAQPHHPRATLATTMPELSLHANSLFADKHADTSRRASQKATSFAALFLAMP